MSSGPYNVRLDGEQARELTARGATLLLLGVPENTILGIDQQSFVVGPRFVGVKMVPPGPHAVSYSASSGRGDFSPITTFFVHVRGGQVVVHRWNAADEVLVLLADEEEAERFAEGVRRFEFDSGLAPYDLCSYNAWRRLSSYITPAVIDALQPLGGNINILAEEDPAAATPAEAALQRQLQEARDVRSATQAAAAAAGREPAGAGCEAMQCDQPPPQGQQEPPQRGEQRAAPGAPPPQQGQPAAPVPQPPAAAPLPQPAEAPPPQAPVPAPPLQRAAPHAGRCFYTPLPRLVKRGGLTPAQLTALNLDKSAALEEALATRFEGSEERFLGEFQFAFIAFLVGQSAEGFAQWKAFLHLLLGCDNAPLGARAALFAHFLAALHAQLAQALQEPGSQRGQPFGCLLMDEMLSDSFMRRLCTQFFQMLHEERPRVAPALAEQAAAVSELLARTLGWGVRVIGGGGGEDEEEEDGPVVVEGVEAGE